MALEVIVLRCSNINLPDPNLQLALVVAEKVVEVDTKLGEMGGTIHLPALAILMLQLDARLHQWSMSGREGLPQNRRAKMPSTGRWQHLQLPPLSRYLKGYSTDKWKTLNESCVGSYPWRHEAPCPISVGRCFIAV